MTFLELVQALHVECGAAGKPPTSVLSQTGEGARLVRWVQKGNMYVQLLWENWKFLRATLTKTLAIGDSSILAPADIGAGLWDQDTFFIQPESDTVKSELLVMEYDAVKNETIDLSSGLPWRAVIMPDNSLRLEGTSDGAHVITADYYRAPNQTELTNNTDLSSIPTKFHDVIVGRALILYGNFENAPEFKAQGKEIFDDYLARLETSQLPNKNNSRYRTGADIVVRPE